MDDPLWDPPAGVKGQKGGAEKKGWKNIHMGGVGTLFFQHVPKSLSKLDPAIEVSLRRGS